MTNSVLGVRNIQHTNGTDAMTIASDGGVTFSKYRPGEVIECIAGSCDGRTVVGLSGSYTFENVTASQGGTTTYTDITGSSINYTPPAGTKKVHYRFAYHFDVAENSGISHHRLLLDGTEIVPAYQSIASNYASSDWNHFNGGLVMEYVIQCDHTSDDLANGRLSSWTTAKNIHCEAREYNASYEYNLHLNIWRDGTGASSPYNIRKPTLSVTAYA